MMLRLDDCNKQSSKPLEYESAASVQTNKKEEVNQDTTVESMDVFTQSQEDNSFPKDDIWAALELKFIKMRKKANLAAVFTNSKNFDS